jgi:hypothetical protein
MLGVDMWMLASVVEAMGSATGSSTHDSAARDAMMDAAFRRREQWGVIPRSMEYLFGHLEARKRTCTIKVTCSYTEIYNEKIYDLLNTGSGVETRASGGGLEIRQDKAGNVFIQV